MIDPNTITTIRVGQLADAPLNLSDNIPHEVGTDLKRATIQELVDFVANAIEVGSGVGYLPLSVTDGQQLPEVPENPSFFLCGAGTFLNINGFPDIICTENLNAIMSLSDHWEIAVQIPITFDTPGSIISQSITEGVTNFAPSEDAVFNFGETLEKLENKISEIVNYSEIDYPNEKAVHDALDMKLNISDLPSNLIFYATTAVADVSGYFKLVDNVEDVDYDEPAVDVSTGAITTTAQLISSLVSAPGLLTGNPGVINITTVGNIKRISGTGAADFYFSAFHRDVAGVETLVGTSNNSETITNSVYEQFTTTLLWNNGDFIETDRIVLKFYANRIAGGGNPTYNFQFGGDTPVRTIIPVPFYILAGEYELKANKQNSLTADLTNLKYPTVTAVNVGLATKQNTLTNPITGTGTTNYFPIFTGVSTLGNSSVYIDSGVLHLPTNTRLPFDGFLGFGWGATALSGSSDKLKLLTWNGSGYDETLTAVNGNRVLIGTSTDNGIDKLQVNGSANFTGQTKLLSGAFIPAYIDLFFEAADNGPGFSIYSTSNIYGNDVLSIANLLFLSEDSGQSHFGSQVNAPSFVKTGGLSTEYLMADGSVTTSGGGGGSTPVKLTSQTLAVASWSLVGSYYTYAFSNVNVTTSCDVSVTPQNASYLTAYNAQVLPFVGVASGVATFYSQFPPSADMVVDIVITQTT